MPEIAKFDPSAINSPLALIALFVAMIELFLLFPITRLEGRDRSLLVYFIIGYPIFIAGSFFAFLWFKPVNLYTPQTLSENLQRALLPENFNRQLAPDRADVAAIQLKVTQLEVQLRDVSHKLDGNASSVVPADVAKLSDLEKLKADLLARAEAAGDLSRAGLATAAKEVRDDEVKALKNRAADASAQLEKFISWLKENGLTVSVPAPTIDPGDSLSLTGPSVGSNDITLGPPNRDFLVPGLYIRIIASKLDVPTPFGEGTFQLAWTTSDYMASQFGHIKFPDPNGFIRNTLTKSGVSAGYAIMYRLFGDLSGEFGDNALKAGVVRMINEWDTKSNLKSSFKSIAAGMSSAGANSEKVLSVLKGAEDQFVAAKAEN
jgi:hypothetical protein